MSYILDALKKADQERKLTEDTKLQGVYPMMLNTYRQYPWLLISVIVAINIILLVLLLWTKTSTTLPIEKTFVKSESIERTEIRKITQVPSQNHQNPSTDQTGIQTLPPNNSESILKLEAINKNKPVATNSNSLLQHSLANHIQTSKPAIPNQVILAQKVVKPSKQEPPFLKKMSLDFQKSVPVLEINAHVYSSNTEQRFVLINGRRYTEGMHLQEGGILENIRANDIIVSYKQQRFRLERP